MKTILYNVLIICSFIHAFAQEQTDYHKNSQNLKGKVKSLVETSFFVTEINGQAEKERLANQDTYLYNEDGFIVENRHSNSGNLLWNDMNIYDDKGNRIVEYRYKAEGDLSWKNTYKYDDFGNQIEKKVYNDKGKMEFKIISTYNEKGDKLIQYRSESTGKGKIITKNVYDNKGNLIEEIMGGLLKPVKIINSYDDNGNKIESHIYNSYKELEEKQTFKYDENGNLIENVIYDSPDFLARKILFVYNSKGDILERSRYQTNGQLLEKDTYEFEYDDVGNLIEEKHYKFYLGTKESYETYKYYDFDENRNWQKKIFYKDGKTQSTIEREIEYY